MSQFNDMMHQGKPLLDIMKSGTPITISVDTKMLKQFLHLFINTPALEECVRLGMNLYNQNISMRREGGQPTGENFGVPQRTFRLRSPSKPREGIETGLGRQNFNEPQGLFPPFAQDGIQIRRFLQFLFHIKVLSIYKDPIHLGQHLIFVDFRRLQSFIEPHIRKTGPTVTINEIFTDDESSSEKDKATSSEEDDEEVVIELPEDLVFEVPVLGAAPLCAAEVRSSATSAVMSTAGLCATVLLSLLLM